MNLKNAKTRGVHNFIIRIIPWSISFSAEHTDFRLINFPLDAEDMPNSWFNNMSH